MNKLIYLFSFLFLWSIHVNIQAQNDKLEIYMVDGDLLQNGVELLSFAHFASARPILTDTLLLKNTSDEVLNIKVRKNEIQVVNGTFNVFRALAQDVPAAEYITPNVWELAPGEMLPSDAYFLGNYFHQGQIGTSTFVYSFLTIGAEGQIVDSVYVTYHFLNNSVTPLDQNDQMFLNKETLVTGEPDVLVSYPVKLFNHNMDSIAMRVEKEVINMEDGHEVYFSFGGEEYESSFDFSSEEGYYIQSMDTLFGENCFTAFFKANGIDGNTELTKVSYIFFNKEEEADQSVITLVFNPSAVGFSELKEYDISSVYPNPTKDVFSIKHNLSSGVSSVLKVYNSLGSLVAIKEMNHQQLLSTFSISDWEEGIYYISIEIDGKPIGTEKLIKE
ncbi:T9SS type A sorting domain-containing protein [Lentimicrobium sp. S6]|uniref:T9SS type A sorting domain-containing protein n=1 Tax=Lentimicrobium sp. S6 TaxID=2735872 RepID=UPI00155308BE|nr:T9SS type A sorting domain-containing protein [Lentimicrobium sp. S6]NPD46246.1 T9SS type A sorting domain-containing protein [Lentimicrobium sp. S6]